LLVVNERSLYNQSMEIRDKLPILRAFYYSERRLPSYSEMMNLFNYQSKGGVAKFVDRLVDEGIVGKSKGKLYPINLDAQVRILGSVAAGFPSMSEQFEQERMSIDQWMIRDPEASYLLQVEGDSMVDAGIHSGDYVLVERTEEARVGDIVIAEFDGEWTMKYLAGKSGDYYLKPANPDFPDMHPNQELRIHAKVIGVIRRYE
jgi:SOS regulatory protein LexA